MPAEDILSLPEMQITEIDRTPQVFQSVTALELQKNGLQSLGDIQLFARLRKLNLQDNSLSDIDELLTKLAGLPFLEELHLEGNPVLRSTFNCRSRILAVCKHLRVLNSKPVTQDDILNAGVTLEKEKEMLATVVESYKELRAHKLALEELKKSPRKNPELLVSNARMALEFDESAYRSSLIRKLIERYLHCA